MHANRPDEFFFAVIDKIGIIMTDAWRTRVTNIMRKCETSRIRKPKGRTAKQNLSQRHRHHGPPGSRHLKSPILNGPGNEEDDFTRAQDDELMLVEADYVIEAERPDDGDIVRVSNDASTDSEDEPHRDFDEEAYEFTWLWNKTRECHLGACLFLLFARPFFWSFFADNDPESLISCSVGELRQAVMRSVTAVSTLPP
jgi:hypothetical protein